MAVGIGRRPVGRRSVSHDDLRAVARLFDDFPATWVISGGWALDLFIGRETREHEDLDVAVDATAQVRLHRQLAGWRMHAAVGRGMVRWSPGMRLESPSFEITARLDGHHPARFHVILSDVHENALHVPVWPGLRRAFPYWYLRTDDGIPFVAPEIPLLAKARMHRPKDEEDLRAVLGLMDSGRRGWLREALETHAPGDPWIRVLAD
jgi:hypothetical protein